MQTRENLSNYDDFDNYDNFFTLCRSHNGYIHMIYGHYHPDDETLFVYHRVHNKQVQDCALYVCSDDDLLKIKENKIYEYRNIEDLVFVYNKLRTSERDV